VEGGVFFEVALAGTAGEEDGEGKQEEKKGVI